MSLPRFLSTIGMLMVCTTILARPTNLVVIMTDEHNIRTLGCYRELMADAQAFPWGEGVAVETPHIDSLARDGALLENFYVSTPVCSPSRAAFLTGMFPHQVGVPTNDLPMYDETRTFAHVLGDAGYATSYIGKWHLDGDGKPQWEPERKFGWQDNRYMFNRGHYKNFKDTPDGPRVNAPMGDDGIPGTQLGDADEASYATDFLMDRTLDFIRQEKDGPFCVMLSLPDPHGPNRVRWPYDTMYLNFTYEAPRTMFKTEEQTPNWIDRVGHNYVLNQQLNQMQMAAIFGMVKCIDDNIGRLLDELEDLGLTEDTLIVFTSDHGDFMGEHRRHNKGLPYEASAKVAFLLKSPGEVPAGKRIQASMTSADFGPTILSLLDIPGRLPSGPGRDFSQEFVDGRMEVASSRATYLRASTVSPNWLAVTDSRHKLVISNRETPWLIDLQVDPDELENHYENPTYAEVRARLTHDLQMWMEQVEEPARRDPGYMRWF